MDAQTLRLLIVDDSADDARIIARQFERQGFKLHWQRVDSRAQMERALAEGPWDAIVSDYAMPQFTGRDALDALRATQLDLPFILVSGAIGEETAVEMMKAGAHDYVLKDKLDRLVPAVRRELAEAEQRSERRRLEAELKHYNLYLEQIVNERTYELEQANQGLTAARDEAVRALSLRNQILANMSHESRTPLTVISTAVEALQYGIYGGLNDQQLPMIRTIQQAAQRLGRLMDNLLDLSSLETQTAQLEQTWFDPVDLIRTVVQSLEPAAQAQGLHLFLEIRPGVPALVEGDPDRVRRVAANLVDNAIKFTPAGQVSVRILRKDDSQWALEVEDTGIGIPQADQERVFDLFWQKDGSATRAVMAGVGLGLTMVKKYIDIMRGHIELASEVGQGSRFTVTLPIQADDAPLGSPGLAQ